jgi:hypothetical protein
VAHGCFWRYHPARAWAWELRLQDEIAPDFRIEESPYCPGGRDVGDEGDGPHRRAFLAEQSSQALAGVEAEAIRRIRRRKVRGEPFHMRILETGLWSALPQAVWDMEDRLSERQGGEFRLLAPDEPESRAAFEAAHPERVEERKVLLAELAARPTLLDDADGDAEDADDGAESGDEDAATTTDEAEAVEENDA